ncbi:MAG: heavy metal translocating P-type ATPase [candidate division Zixibacteria bacterium]|nr:heavy metal translocating P-type ATPase [candidate division Zixibacteria bacterium]
MSEVTLRVEGMHCASCVSSIEKGVEALPGVERVQVNLALGSATVRFEEQATNQGQIIDIIKSLGYTAQPGKLDIFKVNEEELASAKRQFMLAALLTFPLMSLAMFPMINGNNATAFSPAIDVFIQAALAGIILFYAGRSILFDALLQTKHLRSNMNTLIAIGTLTAFGWSLYSALTSDGHGHADLYFETAAMIVTLILLGRYLEARAKGRAGDSLRALMNLRPSTTTAVINGVEIEIDSSAAQPGMILLIKPGERIAADGVITDGNPVVDESMITGESVPVDKRLTDPVIGGSHNGNIPFAMRVTAGAEHSFLSTIIRTVSEAQSAKAPIQRLVDKVAGVFVPIVLGLAALTWLAWYLIAPESPMLIRSVIAILIVACPCALGLATPTAILAASGRAAREGIILRGGDVLEKLASIDILAIDKTGTLTQSRHEVVLCKTFGSFPLREFISIAASLENRSEHPLARSIVLYAKDQTIELRNIQRAETKPGYGVVGFLDDRKVIIGSRLFMESERIKFDVSIEFAEQEMAKGRTVIFVALDSEVIGLFSLSDQLRNDARELISSIRKRLRPIIMSGDNRKTVAGVAHSLGVSQFEAELSPSDKQLAIESLQKSGLKVAMVGDGINDSPALAAATVGIAMGSGTDVAKQTADVVIIRSELIAISRMFELADFSMKIIRQNLFWAFFYNILAIPLAAGVFYSSLGLTLSPVVAALAMSLSSVFVVTNSLRINTVELTPKMNT